MDNQKLTRYIRTNLLNSLFVSLISIMTSCPEEPKPEYEINLDVEDYLCTWVELRVTLPDSGKAKFFSVRSLDSNIDITPVAGVIGSDTVLHIGGLQPETDYSFRAYYLKHQKVVDSSDVVSIHTRETTSSNFRWEIDRIGVHPTCLNDVQIISENDVWVVGDIRLEDTYTYDSAGVWQLPYSAVHWDGEEWKLVRFIGEPLYAIPPTGIHYFSDSSIWFTTGRIFHYDGDTTKLMWTQDYSSGEYLNHVWGSSESDIWFVGTKGLIVHYDGQSFTRVPTGNTIRYSDVKGTPDGKHVFIVGDNILTPYECCVWHFDNGNMKMIYYTDKSAPTDGKFGEVMSVGVYDNYAYFQTAAGLWVYDFLRNSSEIIPSTKDEALASIIAQDRNDVFGFGSIWVHYNGENWITNNELFWDITWPRADFKRNFVVAAGIARDASHGVIIRGYR